MVGETRSRRGKRERAVSDKGSYTPRERERERNVCPLRSPCIGFESHGRASVNAIRVLTLNYVSR